jgi:signal transduction histidine kinase
MQSADLSSLGSILVLAPVGRDAAEIARVLGGIGIPVQPVGSLAALCQSLHADGGTDAAALLVAEEALAAGADMLAACLPGQPPWSDLPVVILTAGGRRWGSGKRWAQFERLGNVTLLDRPVHSETLQSAARAALRARARQHETRRYLEELRRAAETLEARVEERTRELMAVEETLRQAQKMEAVGQLTGGLAHDFNNLLTGIAGSLELLQARLQQGRMAGLERYISVAQTAAQRAAALTHRLLAFSRRQTLDPKPTAANRLITDMMELIQRTVGPEIAIATELAADLSPTLCDPHQLENALLNLCINARDAMPEGGRLTIGTAHSWMDERTAEMRDVAPGPYIAIGVSDTGTGMTREVMARAFDPFFTTKPIGQGTGLGLSMIYGFAKQSGGTVRIHSELGRGTTVWLYLPRHDGEVTFEEAQPGLARAPQAEGGESVLVVDDDPTVRMLITEVLTDMGYAVTEAENGPAGLRLLQSDMRIDLLISDVGMPGGMNGRQLADAARQLRPDLKVLFITGYAEQAVLDGGQMEPGMEVMTKPFPMEAMAARVKEMIMAS